MTPEQFEERTYLIDKSHLLMVAPIHNLERPPRTLNGEAVLQEQTTYWSTQCPRVAAAINKAAKPEVSYDSKFVGAVGAVEKADQVDVGWLYDSKEIVGER